MELLFWSLESLALPFAQKILGYEGHSTTLFWSAKSTDLLQFNSSQSYCCECIFILHFLWWAHNGIHIVSGWSPIRASWNVRAGWLNQYNCTMFFQAIPGYLMWKASFVSVQVPSCWVTNFLSRFYCAYHRLKGTNCLQDILLANTRHARLGQ